MAFGASDMVDANEFLAWNDEDLLAYLQENKQPNGDVDISRIAGFEQLSEEQKEKLAFRFG
jgi:hypothetical protein